MNESFEESVKEGFRVDEETCTFGIITSKGEYKAKSNFTIQLDTFVDAGSSTGFFAYVTRKSDRERRLCYYAIESLSFGKQRFLADIRTTFGSGGFTCALSERELTEFHNYLEKSFPFELNGKSKKGVFHVGKQMESSVWVLAPKIHINSKGYLLGVETSFAWQPLGGPQIEINNASNKSQALFELQSDIHIPLESKVSLNNLLHCMEQILKHNFISGVLTVAAGIMAIHYEAIVNINDSCLIPLLYGDSETGKSTAARCALAICGQHDVGHYMKTKNTSDSLILERIKKSTLPFALDDPKSMDDIGELLIQLCNGRLCGNMRVGVKRPKSIPILCCNFPISTLERYSSRVLLIPFSKPTVGPKNDGESIAFRTMPYVQTKVSSAIGWAISLGEMMISEKEYIDGPLSNRVRKRLHLQPRQVSGYTLLLYFAEKIVEEAGFEYLKIELENFLEESVLPLIKTQHSSLPHTIQKSDVLIQALEEALLWAEQAKNETGLYKVLRTMRIVTYQGRKAIAMCLDDMELSTPATVIRNMIKEERKGIHNVSKDFVPTKSENPDIKRAVNSYSRKCTIVWTDTLPVTLSSKFEEVTSKLSNVSSSPQSPSVSGGDISLMEIHTNTDSITDSTNDMENIAGDLPVHADTDSITDSTNDMENTAGDLPVHANTDSITDSTNDMENTAGDLPVHTNTDSITDSTNDMENTAGDLPVHTNTDSITDSTNDMENTAGDLPLDLELPENFIDTLLANTGPLNPPKRIKRATRSNTSMPNWRKDLNSDDPLL